MSGPPVGAVQQAALRSGVIVALGRVASQVVTMLGGILLARGLPPEVFGIYGVLSYIVTFWAFFGDIGFGPAIVQRSGEPPAALLRSAFTAWCAATGLIIAAIAASMPLVLHWYRLPQDTGWALVALAGALAVSLVRSIPSLLLEREMRFRELTLVDLAETAAFTALAVGLAWLGSGLWSFVGAVWVSRLIGAALVWRIRPWSMGFGWDPEALKTALPIAAPLRLRDVLGLIRSAMNPVVVGTLAGLPAVGYLTWAESMAGLAVFATGVVNRVSLPTFSRLQEDPEAVREMLREAARIGCGWYYPVAALLIGLAPSIVHWIYTDRWAPAVPALTLLLLGGMLTVPILAYDNLFIALNRPRWVLGFGIGTTAANLILGIPLILRFGMLGYPMTKFVISAVTVWVYLRLGRRLVGEVPSGVVGRPLVAALAVWGMSAFLAPRVVRGLPSLIMLAGAMALASFGVLYRADRDLWRSRWALMRARLA